MPTPLVQLHKAFVEAGIPAKLKWPEPDEDPAPPLPEAHLPPGAVPDEDGGRILVGGILVYQLYQDEPIFGIQRLVDGKVYETVAHGVRRTFQEVQKFQNMERG